jgi:hypothetical protein
LSIVSLIAVSDRSCEVIGHQVMQCAGAPSRKVRVLKLAHSISRPEHSFVLLLSHARALTSREDLIDAPGISSATKINPMYTVIGAKCSLFIVRGGSRPRHCDGRRFVRGQESFDQRRATQERYPLLAQGTQQFDPVGIRKRQALQIETYSVGGASCRNDLSCLVDPCTQ